MSLAQLLIEGGFRATAASRITSTVYAGPDATARIGLDGNAATGNFQVSLSPANLTASRRWTFPDADSTVAGLSVANAFTAANSFTQQITSSLATGTAPFSIASTTVVGNLNVSQLLGGTWAIPGSIGSTTPNTGTFKTLTGVDATDTTKVLALSLSGMTTAKTLTLASAQTTTQTLNIPNITGADTLASLALGQTFSGANTFSGITSISNTTSATTSILGALKVGNGTAATSVGIGAGKINCGDSLIAGASSSIVKSAGTAVLSFTIQNTGSGIGTSSALFLDDSVGHLFQIVPDNNGGLTSIKAVTRNTSMDFWTGTVSGASRLLIDANGIVSTTSTTDASAIGTAGVVFTGGLSVAKRSFLGTIGGTFSGNLLAGVQDATAASAGQVGEVLSATQSTYTNYTTTATYQQVTTLSLTAGDWDIVCFGTLAANGSTLTVTANSIFTLSTTTASATGTTEGAGDIAYVSQVINAASGRDSIVLHKRVNINATTSYYLNSQSTFTLGNPQFVGSIVATRIR